MRRRPDLIVPIHDRRKRRRILTLRNFRNAAIAAVVLFIAMTIYFDYRGPRSGEYGRLFSSELPPRVEARPIEVVKEAVPAPVDDQTHADPTLVQPLAREQWLRGDEPATATAAAIATTSMVPPPAPAPVEAATTTGENVTIVGGPEGVSIVRAPRRRAVLSGGFGRSDSN